MHYSGAVYRPPSEARSLIVQCTLGCSHNKCAFCTMYKDKKFSINPIEQVLSDLDEARAYGRYIEKIFLADGDALILPMDYLLTVLDYIRTVLDRTEAVRSCKRVVHDQRDSVTVGNSGDRLDIYHVGIRISERLRIYKLGVFLYRLFKILGIGRIDERNVKSLIAERMFKEVEGSAVEV